MKILPVDASDFACKILKQVLGEDHIFLEATEGAFGVL